MVWCAQLVVVLGCRRRRELVTDDVVVAPRAQIARRRPDAHLLTTSCLPAPTATQPAPPRSDLQLSRRRHRDPERQLK